MLKFDGLNRDGEKIPFHTRERRKTEVAGELGPL